MQHLFPGPEIGRWGPPVTSSLDIQRLNLTLRFGNMMSKPATINQLQEQQEEATREDHVDLRCQRSLGALANAEEGFPQRFPSSRRGSRSFTPFFTHTHLRWGSIDSRGTAADRSRWKGGGSTGSTGLQGGSTSTDTG